MKKITKERIEKINSLDTDVICVTLIDNMELMWTVNSVIENNVSFFVGEVDKYIRNKKWSEEIKNWLHELGERISGDYLNIEKGTNLPKKLRDYLGFDKDDEVAESIIDEYVMSEEQNKDINHLKRELIEQALILDALY